MFLNGLFYQLSFIQFYFIFSGLLANIFLITSFCTYLYLKAIGEWDK